MPRRKMSNPLDRPTYSAAEAARLVNMSPTRVRRWLSGYIIYSNEGAFKRQKPLMIRPGTTGTSYASFLDLVDLLWVKNFLEYGFSLQKMRRALAEVTEVLGDEHFARQSFFTDGRKIYLEVRRKMEDLPDQVEKRAILELLSDGQWVIPEVILEIAQQIEFDEKTELARRWFPPGFDNLIVLDPLVSFGRPHITNKRVATSNILDLYVAENKQVMPVSGWFDISPEEVEAAVGFEQHLAA